MSVFFLGLLGNIGSALGRSRVRIDHSHVAQKLSCTHHGRPSSGSLSAVLVSPVRAVGLGLGTCDCK